MKKYTLCVLDNGNYTAQFSDCNKAVVKQEQVNNYADFKSKIIVTDGTQEAINERIKAMNAKPALNPFKYSEIINTIELNPSYKHTNIFSDKQAAITHIGNFTSWQAKNKVNGRYTTNLTYCVIDDKLYYLTVFSMKGIE